MLASCAAIRFHVAIICTVLFAGCQSPNGSHDDAARIANALEKQITIEEARHILFDDIDRAMQAVQARATDTEDSRTELKILAGHRRMLNSRLESLLSRSRNGDALWSYRTYVTADRRGGESGFALIRDGRVIEHMEIVIID
jgi:hypothetical protein